MENYIIIAIIVLAVGWACYYIWKEKKSGRKCIGCPSSGCCTSKKCCEHSNDKLQ